jgi:uncharacterized membrane protein
MDPRMTIGDIIAVYGAVLSTILAILKVHELYLHRFRLIVEYSFTGSAEVGNEIAIYNPSKNPVTINSFELQFFDKKAFWWVKSRTDSYPSAEGFCNIKIEPQSRYDMSFTESEHFDWGKQKICILFRIAGRNKPVSEVIYTPS